MGKPKIIVCMGLQRSGNHAVLGWVASLFPSHAFYNDQMHDLFADEAALRTTIEERNEPCIIFSFEDSANRTANPDILLVDSVSPFPAALAAEYDVHHVAILRDPYNTWASRVAANERAATMGRPLTSSPSWDLYRKNWLAIAKRTELTQILFNRWKDDRPYREALCAQLGGTYSERTLDEVPKQGAGSSFDGLPRPSYAGMLAQLPKYTSKQFLSRLVSQPGHYIKRFFAPPSTGKTMKVDERWKTLIERPGSQELFSDPELQEKTRILFGAAAVPQISASR